MNVQKTIDAFKTHLKAVGYADKTIELYRWGLDTFEHFLTEKKITDLKQVTLKTILHYQEALMNEPLAKESKAIRIRAVKRLFEHLLKTHKLLINPTEGIREISRIHRKIGIVLTVLEMNRLLDQPNLSLVTGIRDRAVMDVLYTTGIRANELENLLIHHVDLTESVLYIRKGKGQKQRVVPLGKTAARFVTEYLETIRSCHLKKNPDANTKNLFLTVKGAPLTGHAIRQFLKKYGKKAGIEKPVTPHTFRRTCATHMLQQGADIRYISSLLGHIKLSTTQTYTHVLPVDVKDTHTRTHPGIATKKERSETRK